MKVLKVVSQSFELLMFHRDEGALPSWIRSCPGISSAREWSIRRFFALIAKNFIPLETLCRCALSVAVTQ